MMKDAAIAILSFSVGVLAVVVYIQTSTLRSRTRESKSANLNHQAECAKQALEEYNDRFGGVKGAP
jgi:hypothetical protein